MHAFLALIWDENDETATRTVQHLCRLAEADFPRHDPSLTLPGCILHYLGSDRGSDAILGIQSQKRYLDGVVVGSLFLKPSNEEATSRISRLGPAASATIADSRGNALIQDYWGSYIAILKTGRRWSVITDPTSAIPCFYMDYAGITIVFSHLEKCRFLHRLGLTINYSFISALLVYDKISNGETGFQEIRELQAGSRLDCGPGSKTTCRLWDPRLIASDRLEPSPEKAAELLGNVTRAVIATRASGLDAVTVNLSGGLDSSIVLTCLTESGFSGQVEAVHHVVDSGDPSEVIYARAAADAAGCPLTELHFKPGRHLPGIRSHPLSSRPWRQFLSTTPLNGYLIPKHEERVAVFTGQGGDHLFHVAETDAGFSDYLSDHGAGARVLAELLNAARLSGRSIWSVAGRTFGDLITLRRESEMIRTIRFNRNPLNDGLHENLAPENYLPDWAVYRKGVPRGKFDQVSALQHLFMIRETLDLPVLRNLEHPLISQPLIELCLRLPVYLLCAGGISRGLAREAFRGQIPDMIRTRMTKGETTRYFVAGIQADLPVIADALRSGILVSKGLIPPDALEQAVAQDRVQTAQLVRRLRMAYTIEAWLQSWQEALGETQGVSA